MQEADQKMMEKKSLHLLFGFVGAESDDVCS